MKESSTEIDIDVEDTVLERVDLEDASQLDSDSLEYDEASPDEQEQE